MANGFFITNAVAQGMLNGTTLSASFDAGTAAVIEIYAGAVPADADATPSSPTLLATLTCAATCIGAFSDANPGGRATFAGITSDSSADNTGTPAYFRIKTQTGGTVVCQGTAGNNGCDLNLGVSSIAAGAVVSCSSATITLPEG